MTHSRAYMRVAERALMAAEPVLAAAVQEKAGFLAYHAFESAGGAFCVSRGVSYPMGHRKKLRTFTAAARLERYARQVAELSILVGSLRNLLLYPRVLQNGLIGRPEDVMTEKDARRLIGRVRTLVSRVGATI